MNILSLKSAESSSASHGRLLTKWTCKFRSNSPCSKCPIDCKIALAPTPILTASEPIVKKHLNFGQVQNREIICFVKISLIKTSEPNRRPCSKPLMDIHHYPQTTSIHRVAKPSPALMQHPLRSVETPDRDLVPLRKLRKNKR